MVDASFPGGGPLRNKSPRVLLCIANPRDRELLAEQLRETELDVRTADGTEPLPKFDLCVADTTTFPSIADSIAERRAELGSVRLPVLLVLGPNDSEQAAEPYWDNIDDVLSVPTSKRVFRHRVSALLRSRTQSEQLALFARAMDDAKTGISIADAGGDQELRYVNDAFLEITGYDRSEVLGRNCRFLQGPETETEPVREVRRAIDEQRPVSVLLRNYRKNGELFWNDLEISPVYGEGDTATHFVGFQEDVTERVERTRLLRRYEEIVTAAGDPIYALDERLHFTLLNDATEKFAERPEDEILGTHVSSVFGTDHAEVLSAAALNLADSDTDQMSVGTVVENADGRPRRFQTTVGVLPTETFEGVVCVSRDITEDRERESRISVLDRVLRHNLRNKLLVMLAQAEQIQWHSEDERVTDAASTIEQAGEDLLELAETARKFTDTVDPGGDELTGPIDIADRTIRAVAETRMEFENATFSVDVPDSLWAIAHNSFELAMTELLERAAEAGDTVEVTVSMAADDDRAVVRVSHDGEGLSEVELAALNEGTESDLQHTTGLGLWFIRWMAVNSGGTFDIADTDPGTVVKLTLPLADVPPGTTTRT
ncbi:PAS domain S-box protein [Haloarcula laminariae]|uniref:PAS domain S-box protein n=1 Tax=Haloarcula laminariae TaxID=2961577 RepID=UPI002406AF27|nr:PAS domain S-box protein [Halomicroarcula sp. FL173]